MNLWDIEASPAPGLSPEVTFPLSGTSRASRPAATAWGCAPTTRAARPASPEDVRIPARVEVEEVSGSETLVHAAHGGLSLTAQVEGIHRHPYGAPVELFVSPSRMFVFGPEGRLPRPLHPEEPAHGQD